MSADTLLEIRDLVKHFDIAIGAFGDRKATVHAVSGLDLDIRKGETLSLVGESGCGKSTAGMSILQLHKPTSGSVVYEGRDLAKMPERELRALRQRLQIVFQDPYSTLNPRMTVGEAIAEPVRFHLRLGGKALKDKVNDLLGAVGLPQNFANRYPHALSGGQRQRVVIARALACGPEFMVCDESISALDVSVQAQIINLLQDLQEQFGLTYLFIAHDLAVVRHISDRVGVMYLGRMAELAPKADLFDAPLHPYTRALLSAVAEPDPVRERSRKRQILPGDIPSPLSPPSGCRFHTRCPIAGPRCSAEQPAWRQVRAEHWVACHAVDDPVGVVG